jgi:hypothetical protein
MRIPEAENAVVVEAKVVEYLLNVDHPDGAPKARLLVRAGFDASRPDELTSALLQHVLSEDAREGRYSPFGRKYEIAGSLTGPGGSVRITSVWIIRHGESFPRLVTVVPEAKS